MAGQEATKVSPLSRYAAEFLGTFLLVFTVCCNVYTGSGAWAATSIACVLMVSIYACAKISGANFNPAVTLAIAIVKHLKNEQPKHLLWKDAGIYCAVQLLGGLTAGLVCIPLGSAQIGPRVEGTVDVRWYQCALAELLYSCMLCFVVLNVAVAKKNTAKDEQFFGLAIGFVIIAGGYAVGGISGGCFNPAVALGVGFRDYYWFPLYWLAEFLGGAAAAGLFRACRPDDFGADLTRGEYVYPIGSKALSEVLGTFFLVLTVELNATQGSVAAVWSIAASLMCMIFALGSCSGAHFNPAVTVAILCTVRDKIDPKTAGIYMGSQVAGGVLGALVGALLMRGSVTSLGPGDDFSWMQASTAELMFTMVLCFTVLSVATVSEKQQLSQYFGLAIASCVTVGGLAIGKISGGSLNPAVSVGISTAELLDGGRFWQCIPYTIMELLGGALAAAIFRGTRPSEYV